MWRFDGSLVDPEYVDVSELAAANQSPPCNAEIVKTSEGYETLTGEPLTLGTDFFLCQKTDSTSEVLDALNGKPCCEETLGENIIVNPDFLLGQTAATAGNEFATGWTASVDAVTPGTYPADTEVAAQTGTFSGGSLLNQVPFPGDPAYGVPATNGWLYSNGNDTGSPYISAETTVTLEEGCEYEFAAYTSSVIAPGNDPTDDSILQFVLDGQPFGAAFTELDHDDPASTDNGQDLWHRRAARLTAATSGPVTLQLRNDANGTFGNDLALTQVQVQKVDPCDNGGSPSLLCAIEKLCDKQEETNTLLESNNALLASLVDCLCGPCESAQNMVCESYANPLTAGYENWTDEQDFDALADEFNCTPSTPREHWIRIVEHDCDGVTQSTVGQIFGPYSIPQPVATAADTVIADIGAATASSCITINPGSNPGPSSIGLNVAISYSDAVTDATLAIQEGVTIAGGGVCWFTSSHGFYKRGNDVGDWINSTGDGATTNYAAQDLTALSNSVSTSPATGCEPL